LRQRDSDNGAVPRATAIGVPPDAGADPRQTIRLRLVHVRCFAKEHAGEAAKRDAGGLEIIPPPAAQFWTDS